MPTTDIQICNTAIARIGSTMFIESMSEASKQAQVCNLFYKHCLDQVLQDCPWKFARKTIPLQLLTDTVPGWEYVYSYPNDCVKALRLVYATGAPAAGTKIIYDIVSVGNGKAIVCNEPEMYLEYTKRVENTSLFDAMFASAFAWLLASEISTPLVADAKSAQSAMSAYKVTVSDALAASWNEGYEGQIPDSEFIRVRS